MLGLLSCRPARGVSRARVSHGVSQRVSPKTGVSDRVSHGCVPGVSKRYPEHSGDTRHTFWILWSPGPKGPRGHSVGHPRFRDALGDILVAAVYSSYLCTLTWFSSPEAVSLWVFVCVCVRMCGSLDCQKKALCVPPLLRLGWLPVVELFSNLCANLALVLAQSVKCTWSCDRRLRKLWSRSWSENFWSRNRVSVVERGGSSPDWHSQIRQVLSMSEWKLLGLSDSDRQPRNLRSRSDTRKKKVISAGFLAIEVSMIGYDRWSLGICDRDRWCTKVGTGLGF